jgi:hypothetical protein
MIWFPGETEEEVKKTIDFAVSTPFKGTALRNDMQAGRFGEEGRDSISLMDDRFPVVKSSTLTPEVLRRYQMNAYWRFYTKPRSIPTSIRRFASTRNARKMLRVTKGRISSQKHVSVN